MVQRRFLTPDFVNSVQPPVKGEVWIADTEVKGFGLRLFVSMQGGKSYSIRVSDKSKRTVRRAFDIYKSSTYLSATGVGILHVQIGDFLDEARSWAIDEIGYLKIPIEEHCEKVVKEPIFTKATFEQAVGCLLDEKEKAGGETDYLARLGRMFHRWVPSDMRSKVLSEISSEALAETLIRSEIGAGTVKTLRWLIGQLFERAEIPGLSRRRFARELSKEIARRKPFTPNPYN